MLEDSVLSGLVVRCEAPERSAFLVDVGNSGVPQSIGVKLKRAGYWILASRSDRLIKIVTLMPTIFDSWMEAQLTTGDGSVRLRTKGSH
jgi:hypothetical protein